MDGQTTALSRRELLQAAGAVAWSGGERKPMRKPNLLVLWTDEQRADTMAAYGNRWVKTPALNKLASESVVVENTYVSQPVCTPSRATVMTGLWPHQCACTANNIPLPAPVRCFPELLGDAGYHTAYMGKWHLGDEVFAQHGFEEWVSIEDGYTGGYGAGRDRSAKSSYWRYLHDLGYEPDAKGRYSRGFAAHLPIDRCKPKFLETRAIDFLRRRRHDRFILYVNFLEPHMPFYGPLNDLYDPQSIPLPANFDDPLEDDVPLRYRLLRQAYNENGFEGQDLRTEAGWRRLRANYHGLVSQVDRTVGAILGELERLGLGDDTIVVYTSDHGDMMGSHRLLAKTVMYEEAVRVLWLMRVPGMPRRQHVLRGRYSQIDLVPTLLDLMGREPANLPGRSLAPLLHGQTDAQRDVFIEWNGAEGKLSANLPGVTQADVERVQDAPIRTVITQDGWKLCLSRRDRSQLFDLNCDPGEAHNLFTRLEHRQKVQELTQRIHGWQATVKDTAAV